MQIEHNSFMASLLMSISEAIKYSCSNNLIKNISQINGGRMKKILKHLIMDCIHFIYSERWY